jgi:hypothetical protein
VANQRQKAEQLDSLLTTKNKELSKLQKEKAEGFQKDEKAIKKLQ